MKKPRQFSWIMKTSKKAVSVNASYRAVIKNGHPQLFKTKEAREYISELIREIELLDVPDWVRQDGMSFKMYIKVLFREGYYARDLDNVLKATIDAMSRAKQLGATPEQMKEGSDRLKIAFDTYWGDLTRDAINNIRRG